jgi:DNA polymerase III alpha subunit
MEKKPPLADRRRALTFITLEDETGITNLVVWPAAFESTAASS